MFQGELVAITTRPKRKDPVVEREEVVALAGAGLEGDHVCNSDRKTRQVTFFESESLEAAQADYDLTINHAESRRNLLTRGVPLNHLVGRQFRVGEAVFRGVELCEPCDYLGKLLNRYVVGPLKHRGGLCAEVLQGGTLRIGDSIEPMDEG